MSRFGPVLALGCLAAFGPSAAHAAPLRGYTVAELGQHGKFGIDNDGNLIDGPVRTIVGAAPTFDLGYSGGTDPRLGGRAIKWAEVTDGTPDGRYMITTGGAGAYPVRSIIETFVANPNNPINPTGWYSWRLQDDHWTSIRGTDVNASGEIIGQLARVVKDGPNGVEWDRGYFYAAAGETTVHELAELLPPGSGWSNVSLLSINDGGQILGEGLNPEGEPSKFLLTPNSVPEPATWAVFGLVAAAIGLRARRPGV